MAWWEEALTGDGSKGRGEPLVEAMRRAWPDAADRERMSRVIDGWEALMLAERLDEAALAPFAAGRGALFGLLGGGDERLGPAGAAWALWDLSGHVSDRAAGSTALAMAAERLERVPTGGWSRALAPLRVLTGLVRADVPGQPGRLFPQQHRRVHPAAGMGSSPRRAPGALRLHLVGLRERRSTAPGSRVAWADSPMAAATAA